VKASFKPVLREALLIALAGALLAFAANALSPSGLNIRRNYFPADTSSAASAGNKNPATSTNAVPAEDDVVARLKQKGLQPLNTTEARKLFDDPRHQQGLILFIDVRKTEEYEEAHIPGAQHFDYYYPGNDVGPVVAACQPAEKIVVYCGGGKCDLSENAALMLRDNAGIPGGKIFIYTGGITEWKEKNFPVETGARNSGKLIDPSHAR